jgi:type I restriction enzyme S subunit
MNENQKMPNGWEKAIFEDLLDYIQPTQFIVESTDYDDNYKTPVLTAGKSFILGKTNETKNIFTDIPVIIFDDFTTATQFVNFSFKVKSSALKILSPVCKLVNIKFVFWYMQTIRVNADTHKRYWISHYSRLPILLPPLLEQQRIVARIEELFSSLDKGIESLKTAQQQLKIYRQSVLKWAFEGKLTNKNVKEGELPEGWKWLKLDDVVDEFVRGPFGGSLKKECFVPKGYKVYEQKNAIYQSTELGKYFINENKFKELIRFKVKPYDFIVSCSGTIGKLFMIPEKAPKGIINQALLIIRINRDLLLEKFFMHLFTSSFFQRLIIKDAKGTAMLNLAGVKDMKLVPVLLPPIREQQAIVAEIESRLSVCDKIEESIEQSLKQAEALRQSILKKAFEGKLFSQDPNDEPASKLLERIKVEREKTAIKKRSKN